jgi:rhodanese-related sulfurtransferase
MTEKDHRIETYGHQTRRLVLCLIVAGGVVPLILYWFFSGRVPTIRPNRARELLRTTDSSALLIDVRDANEFALRHIDGAQNFSSTEIFAADSKSDIPEQFRDRTLLLICDAGILSNFATRHLTNIGLENVMNIRGGTQDWIGSIDRQNGAVFDRWKTASGVISEFPFRQSPWYDQLLAVINGFVIKPTYMLLSVALFVVLWRSRSADLVSLRWAMKYFFLGEACCAIYYAVFNQTSYLFEYLHCFGMLLCFGLVTYAVLEGMDRRILLISVPGRRCAALGLCKRCIKDEDVPCGLRRMFLVIIPAMAVIAFMPLCVGWHYTSYNTIIFGTFYNYSHRVIYQVFERLYCPIISIVLLAVSLLILVFRKKDPLTLAKVFFAAGMGPLGFGLLRTILAGNYNRNMVWFDFWEEATELLLVVGICIVLWIFRHELFKKARTGTRRLRLR